MNNKDDIKTMLDYFQKTEDKPLLFDEDAIVSAYRNDSGNQSLSVKILSVFGGILASSVFLSFLSIFYAYVSLILGGIFIAASIWINKKFDKFIMDTVSISCFIIGFILIGLGFEELDIDGTIISIVFIIIACGSLCIVQNYILSFVSVLVINGSLLMLITWNEAYDAIHAYVILIALAMTYIFLKEAMLIKARKSLSKLYNPVRIGLIFSFLPGLVFLGKRGLFPVSPGYIWLSSIVIIAAIVFLVSKLFNILNITEPKHRIGIYIFTVLALSLTALSPAISGAILIMLLSFLVNYKTGFVLGIISFIYFISQYYYDLNFTLLTKSILLFSTGVVFVLLYLFTSKKLAADEKV